MVVQVDKICTPDRNALRYRVIAREVMIGSESESTEHISESAVSLAGSNSLFCVGKSFFVIWLIRASGIIRAPDYAIAGISSTLIDIRWPGQPMRRLSRAFGPEVA